MISSSRSLWVCVRTDRTAAPRVAAELNTGITTDTRGTAISLQTRNDGPFKHRNRLGAALQIVVAGQGYVGLPLAVRAAEAGHLVVGYDVDPHRIQQLAASDSYVEDVSSRWRLPFGVTADPNRMAPFGLFVAEARGGDADPEFSPGLLFAPQSVAVGNGPWGLTTFSPCRHLTVRASSVRPGSS
ncbi:hypothetical protein [Streptomyces sp. NPDC056387]|uniref:hypothetical protein n=1 Tax=Streptomyces sp. NPDC056387 TaxID=3345803 RepID=UPI0035D961B3